MQVPILDGVFSDSSANFLTSYPINFEPVIGQNGISGGYLRLWPGIDDLGVIGPGASRGAILWSNKEHRVMGAKLISTAGGTISILGDVPDVDLVSMDYSFDRLAIVAGGGLRYWNGSTMTPVTDPNLGVPIGVVWIDGYFCLTDGTFLYVTNLDDPTTINPLKYGSSEADPDPILAVLKVRDELYAVNRNTIENFTNVGGTGFPFQRNPGGLIPRGAVGRHAWAYMLDTFVFVGNGRDETPSVWIAGYGTTTNISTPQIDREINAVAFDRWLLIEMETVQDKAEQRLMIHLPDVNKTLVYYHQASIAAGRPVWTILRGGPNADQAYPGRHFVQAESFWVCGTETDGKLGVLNEMIETHWNAVVGWRFDTAFLYNEARGGILKSVELIGLPGRMADPLDTPVGYLSWTQDGLSWSAEYAISLGNFGDTLKRMQWRPKTRFRTYMGLRFRGSNAALNTFARLEVDVEPLNG